MVKKRHRGQSDIIGKWGRCLREEEASQVGSNPTIKDYVPRLNCECVGYVSKVGNDNL